MLNWNYVNHKTHYLFVNLYPTPGIKRTNRILEQVTSTSSILRDSELLNPEDAPEALCATFYRGNGHIARLLDRKVLTWQLEGTTSKSDLGQTERLSETLRDFGEALTSSISIFILRQIYKQLLPWL